MNDDNNNGDCVDEENDSIQNPERQYVLLF